VRPAKTALGILLVVGTVSITGCSNKTAVRSVGDLEKDELTDIYECYTEYVKNHQRPPQQLADFKKYEAIHPLGTRVLREGKYIAVWGVAGKDTGTVIAYAKEAPTQGGLAVMGDGSIKTLTADQVQAAIKPAKP
jgi:hypothetical protein